MKKLMLVFVSILIMSGCATRGYVNREIYSKYRYTETNNELEMQDDIATLQRKCNNQGEQIKMLYDYLKLKEVIIQGTPARIELQLK